MVMTDLDILSIQRVCHFYFFVYFLIFNLFSFVFKVYHLLIFAICKNLCRFALKRNLLTEETNRSYKRSR